MSKNLIFYFATFFTNNNMTKGNNDNMNQFFKIFSIKSLKSTLFLKPSS